MTEEGMSSRENIDTGLLVVDDEENTLSLVSQLFRGEFPVHCADSGIKALSLLEKYEIGVVVADQRMPAMTGTELFSKMMSQYPETIRIILTAFADIDTLTEAINAGKVYQYIPKPWDNRDLAITVRSAMDTYKLRKRNSSLLQENARLVEELRQANFELERENLSLKREVQGTFSLENIVGISQSMKTLLRMVEKATDSTATVMLTGETGTGKEVIARAIHYNGPRRNKKFVAQNCGSLPESLLESELFGHTRGAFTGAIKEHRGLFEEAHGGTIFLDEIGDMQMSMQVKLLRVLEEGEIRKVGSNEATKVDVRVISATNKNLSEQVEKGLFRQDLFYRLDVLRIQLPPLRERHGDIPLLAKHFFDKYNRRSGQSLSGISPEALQSMEGYNFPGNVRELENAVERAVALANPNETIDVDLLTPEISGANSVSAGANLLGQSASLSDRLRQFERRLILEELERNNQNRTHSAEKLGISVRALQKKMISLGLRELETVSMRASST